MLIGYYRDLHEIVDLVGQPNRESVINAYVQNAERIAATPGARKKHQAWPGGYLDHVVYATNYALALHNLHQSIGFKPDHHEEDIALVMLIHDFGKVARYQREGEGYGYVENPDEAEHTFFDKAMHDFKFQLTDNQLNALEFIHGEGAKYTPKGRLMLPLATVCHEADTWQARYCPDNPLPDRTDPWPGAFRHYEKEDLVSYLKVLEKL